MRVLMDTSAQRMIRILEILLDEDGSMTLDRLALALNASQRTLADDLNLLQNRWGNVLHLEVTRKNGVQLHNRNISATGQVFRDLFNDSVALRWIRELLFHPRQSLEAYEQRLFVSNSTLKRLLPRIQNFLSQRGMSIAQENGKYWFEGNNEQYLRDFSASFLLELHGLDLSSFDVSMDLEVLGNIILSLQFRNIDPQHHEAFAQDDLALTYEMMFYLVSLVRESTGFHIPSVYPAAAELSATQLACLTHYFPHIKEANLCPIHEYLRRLFHAFSDPAEEAAIQEVIESFLTGLLRDLRLAPNPTTRIRLNFILHSVLCSMKVRPYKTSSLFDRILYFSKDIQRQNPFLYETTRRHLEEASRNLDQALTMRIADVLFWICLTYPELTSAAPPLRILLLNDLGSSHSQFLQNLVRRQLQERSGEVIIESYPHYLPIDQDRCKSYDLVLSTCPDSPPHPHSLFLSDYPLEADWYALRTLVRELSDKQRVNSDSPLS